MNNSVLYYPTIEFNNPEWLWASSLLYDRIYRIVPDGYTPEDTRNIEEICSTEEIGISISPNSYAKTASEHFINKIESGEWDAAGLTFSDNEMNVARLHPYKCDEMLRQLIIAQRPEAIDDEFMPVSSDFAASYMTFLAKEIASKNKLQVSTDSIPAYTASNYFQYDGKMDIHLDETFGSQLGFLVISDFLPENILSLKPKEILKFRSRFVEERRSFISSINKSASDIAECKDHKIIQDMISDLKRDVDRKTKEFKDTMRFLGVKEFAGIKTVTLPIATGLIPALMNYDLANPGPAQFLASVGAAAGLAIGIGSIVKQQRDEDRKFEYSYLLKMGSEFSSDPRRTLGYSFKEFIDD